MTKGNWNLKKIRWGRPWFSEWRGPSIGLDEGEVEGWENVGLDVWCGLRIKRRLM